MAISSSKIFFVKIMKGGHLNMDGLCFIYCRVCNKKKWDYLTYHILKKKFLSFIITFLKKIFKRDKLVHHSQ